MTEDGLILKNLAKSFDGHMAISDVSLDVPKGKLTVLLGPSGCGKSTLLRMIAGFEAPSRGTIHIGTTQIDQLPPASRNISMVFQSYALFPHMSVAENILFGLQVRKTSKDDQSERLNKVATLMGLSELLDRRPSQLSGGQQQRVALARAVISERPVCLMDEALSNLDAKLRHEMRTEIRKLQQQLGLTMVYVTHDQVEAITMADQIVLLNSGQIEQIASPREIYDRPASMFTAKFIGSPPMNLIPAPDLMQNLVRADALSIPDHVTCGIRPEDIEIVADGGFVEAQLGDIEYQGADQLISCRLGKSILDIRVPSSTPVPASNTAQLKWRDSALHLFDTQSGLRMEVDALEVSAPQNSPEISTANI